MLVTLFVYGTLKEGFPNDHFNDGRRVPGVYQTKDAFPLWVVKLKNEDRAAWLMNQRGHGFQVRGQVFEVDAASLPAIDELEEVGLPTGYIREIIEVQDVNNPSHCLKAYAYLKPEDHWQLCLAREGPFDEYTLELAQGYWLTAA